jgi:hypothetical protein
MEKLIGIEADPVDIRKIDYRTPVVLCKSKRPIACRFIDEEGNTLYSLIPPKPESVTIYAPEHVEPGRWYNAGLVYELNLPHS